MNLFVNRRWLWLPVSLPLLAAAFGARASVVESLVISEVFYDAASGDNGFEWIELFNGSGAAIDLAGWTIGFGGSSYTSGLLDLQGVVEPGFYFVAGGPESDQSNGFPVFDQAVNITPDLQNSGTIADGVALFNLVPSAIESFTIPFDAVIYGVTNSSGLLDSFGGTSTVHVGDAPAGQSIERFTASEWRIGLAPEPGTGALHVVRAAEVDTASMVLTGLLLIIASRLLGRKRAGVRFEGAQCCTV